MEKAENQCCSEFKPELWDEKTLNWNKKLFVKTNVCTLFYIPLNFGKKMTKLVKLYEQNNVQFTDEMCITKHISPWKMDLYLGADKALTGYESEEFTGNFFCKVFEGSFNDTGKWTKQFIQFLNENSMKYDDILYWYTTCPKCAKKYGKNYVVLIAKLK